MFHALARHGSGATCNGEDFKGDDRPAGIVTPSTPMWIVKLALNRPYTFIILALLILMLAPATILHTPTDIFPNINIPVISVAWTYTGLNPEDLETRLTTPYEKVLTTLVDNIQHIESTTYNGTTVVKIFLQPGTSLDTANAQVVASSQFVLRFLPHRHSHRRSSTSVRPAFPFCKSGYPARECRNNS
jgi:multidrug efflux pump subunit AcrB